jgi:hypothetical protein
VRERLHEQFDVWLNMLEEELKGKEGERRIYVELYLSRFCFIPVIHHVKEKFFFVKASFTLFLFTKENLC